jgi:hypothetical protein
MAKNKKQHEYHILWEIDLSATSPKDAAEQAARYQRDSDGVFDVTNERGKTTRVDLAE